MLSIALEYQENKVLPDPRYMIINLCSNISGNQNSSQAMKEYLGNYIWNINNFLVKVKLFGLHELKVR